MGRDAPCNTGKKDPLGGMPLAEGRSCNTNIRTGAETEMLMSLTEGREL